MDILTKNELQKLIEKRGSSCISIYMPTYRTSPGVKQNPIRYKNLLKQMEQRLIAVGMRKTEIEALSAPAEALVKDYLFWQYQSDGMAAFISPQWFRFYRLPALFEKLLVITDRFHIKPLLHLFANDGRFYILALSQNEVRLLQCSRHGAILIESENIPRSLKEAIRHDEPDKQLQFHTRTPGGMGERSAIFHGHGAGKDEKKNDILRFFHRVDQGLEKILREDPAPVVLAGVDYLFPIYRQASNYPHLIEQGISGNPEGLKPEMLQKQGWEIAEPHFLKAREEATARYTQLAGSGRASCDIKTITLAAYQGRIDILFTAVGIQQWGIFDPATSSVHIHEEQKPGYEDLLDFAAAHTILNGGKVYVMTPEEMPDAVCMAGIFRY
jgi:hypothetical protein